jgi:hypothetical protein
LARLRSKALFFTTSPRTPAKMIPEIRLLHELFEGRKWDSATQEEFMDRLAESDFFEGAGSPNNKAFSARDRINRAPKALGFVDLRPSISLTDAGNALVYGKRPQEIFLRQLLKFQLPSPYHIENKDIAETFNIRPYLEIMRLVRELERIAFDELKIFVVGLTDYHGFEDVKSAILAFREEKKSHAGEYKKFADEVWTKAIMAIYRDQIEKGKTRTRETADASLKKFISTKKSNLRDYADACFRYLRYTGLFVFGGHSLEVASDRIAEVDHILETVNRDPVFIDNETEYKARLFSSAEPALYVDIKDNIVDALMRIGKYTKRELIDRTIDDLKDLRDDIVQRHKNAIISAQVEEIKSYSLYSEILDTYNEIITDEYYDAPLMLEYNTWRAMTMLDGGDIKGNFKFDDAGRPLSTAQGNMPDIECDYGDFVLSVEVTLRSGQRQFEAEGESIARHYGQLQKRAGKNGYCLFIAPTINRWVLKYFFSLNKISVSLNVSLYGEKTQIIPLDLDRFMRLVENSYNYDTHPTPRDVQRFLDSAIARVAISADENEWDEHIQKCIDNWLMA